MTLPIQITFRGMEAREALESLIHEKARELEKFGARITRMHVIVEAPSHHHRHGQNVHVTIEMAVPEHDLVVSRDPAGHDGHEDAYVAVRDAFRTAKKELRRHLERMQEKSKHGTRIADELG